MTRLSQIAGTGQDLKDLSARRKRKEHASAAGKPVLIVCPSAVLPSWEKHLAEWGHFASRSILGRNGRRSVQARLVIVDETDMQHNILLTKTILARVVRIARALFTFFARAQASLGVFAPMFALLSSFEVDSVVARRVVCFLQRDVLIYFSVLLFFVCCDDRVPRACWTPVGWRLWS